MRIIQTLAMLLIVSSVSAEPVKILIVTGGHDFQREAFFDMFESFDDVEYKEVVHPKANPIYTDGTAMKHDVIVMYDMYQPITDAQKEGMLNYLNAGKGMVVLHHCLASYQAWPEFLNIVGGTYILDKNGREINETTYPQSTYKHDVDMDIHVKNTKHPVTKGLSDYTIHDETYGGLYVAPDVNVLLTCDHPTSSKKVAWTKRYGKAKVVAIQGGHDAKAYQNKHFRKLLHNAIQWSAKIDPSISLFNGKDLSGWKKRGNAVWEVKDGMLIGRQGPDNAPGDLFTKKSYRDFEMVAEFKVQWPANSGIWFRYQDDSTAYQADILEYTNPKCWSGSLYCSGKMFIAMNEDPELVNREGWNTFVVRCKDDHIKIHLNGTEVANVHDSSSIEGQFGIQVHAGDQFKDMKIMIRKLEVYPL